MLKMERFAILLVDDKEEFVTALSNRLLLQGMDVHTATKGEDALAMLQEKTADVVILDVVMPGMGGLETLRRIRETYPHIQVILLTGHASTKEGMEGMRLGAFDYLMKPVDIEELIAKMKASIKAIAKE